MRLAALLTLTRLNLSREKRGALFAVFGVAVGVGSLVFFVALGLGVGRVVREQVFPVDAALLDVVPPQVSFGRLLGGGTLDEDTVARLRALPGVAAVYRKMNVRVPAVSRYEGSFFGSQIHMGLEILAVGVDPGLLDQEVTPESFVDRGPEAPIPGVAAKRVLEIYNKTFAPARHLPMLAPAMLKGFVFPIEFNRSYVARVEAGTVIPARIEMVGFSDRVNLAAVTIPLAAAVRLNLAAKADATTFTAVTLRATDPSVLPALEEAVKKMGLTTDDQDRKLAKNAGLAVALTTSALALLSVLICLLAAVNIAQTLFASVRARTREIGVLRAVGASRSDVRGLILAEAAVTGMLGGLFGVLAAVGLGLGADGIARSVLPPFPFQPDRFFTFSPLLLLGGVLLGLVAALAGAFFPSRHAAAVDPARTLAG